MKLKIFSLARLLQVLHPRQLIIAPRDKCPSRPGAVGPALSGLLRLTKRPSRLAWRAGYGPEVHSPPRVALAGPHLVRPSFFGLSHCFDTNLGTAFRELAKL